VSLQIDLRGPGWREHSRNVEVTNCEVFAHEPSMLREDIIQNSERSLDKDWRTILHCHTLVF
jgi:hypothetical protein